MIFQVEWQEIVYDDFEVDKPKAINHKAPFEIEVSSLEKGREIAESRATSRLIREQTIHKTNHLSVAKVIALIDEVGVRHQFLER